MADSARRAPGRKVAKAQTPDWFEREAAPGATMAKLGRRLLRRGRVSWPMWASAALVVSVLLTLAKVMAAGDFEGTVVVRVTEGKVAQPGAGLGPGRLRGYVDDLAFTNARLVALMSRHRQKFPRVVSDPVFAVQGFRENMSLEISQNDFVQERGRDDPPRSARLVINFKANDPELAWQIAQELAELISGSTTATQRAALEAELQAATAEASSAAIALGEVAEQRAGGPSPKLAQARDRLLAAQARVEEATVGLRALGQQQGLRFEIVERGRVPPRPNKVLVAIKAFTVSLLLALIAGWLLAGAFDPRVLDEADVTDIAMPVLGRLPGLVELPARRGGAEANDEARSGRAPDSRV